MALDLSKTTKKAPVSAATLPTYSSQNAPAGSNLTIGGSPNQTFATGGGFVPAVAASKPPTTVSGGSYANLASTNVPNVPQSYVDEVVNKLNNAEFTGGDIVINGRSYPAEQFKNDPTKFTALVQGAWSGVPTPDQDVYKNKDAVATSTAANDINKVGAAKNITSVTNAGAGATNQFWDQYVIPELKKNDEASQKQIDADRYSEGQMQANADTYGASLDQVAALRNSGIDLYNNQTNNIVGAMGNANAYTNDANNQIVGQLGAANKYTNDLNYGIGNQLNQTAGATNAQQSALFNTLNTASNNAYDSQQQNLNVLQGNINNANSTQGGNLNRFSQNVQDANHDANQAVAGFNNQIGSYNGDQNQTLNTYLADLSQLNDNDKASYMQYLQETNPQMATLVAQASDTGLVQNQKDALAQYKALSNPEVTAQERLVASQARQNFENADRSSRDAVMAQLAGRGLKSGALAIANQQSTQEQLANDRMNAELGISASAQQRALQGLAGYTQTANTLRSADDALKQFQDQYAQNEMQRQSALAQQRDAAAQQLGAANTARAGNAYTAGSDTTNSNFARTQAGYNAGQDVINNNFARDQAGYTAATDTNNQNFGRSLTGYNASNDAINDAFSRAGTVYSAGTQTNDNNYGRTADADKTNLGINNDAYARTYGVAQTGLTTNNQAYDRTADVAKTALGATDQEFSRSQYGWDSGDTDAGNKLNAQDNVNKTRIGDYGSEKASASGDASGGVAAGAAAAGIQGGLTKEQIDAINAILGIGATTTQEKVAGAN